MPVIATLLTAPVLAHAGHGGHGGWWFGPLIPLLWITLIGLTVWLVTRRRGRCAAMPSGNDRARDVLAERYARGELTTEDYRERLANLV